MNPLRHVPSLRGRIFGAASSFAFATLLALDVLSTPALAHAAAPGPVLETGINGRVQAGETIELKWDGVDSGVDELEIQLSVDGGRHFALRASPELDARTGRYLWHVPNLAAADARLRVRFQRGGREVEGGVSAAFSITPNLHASPDYAQIHDGAWWSGARDAETAAAPGAIASTAPELNAGGAASAPGTEARGLSLPALVAAPSIDFAPDAAVPPAAASRETPAPRVIAQRN